MEKINKILAKAKHEETMKTRITLWIVKAMLKLGILENKWRRK
jgi:hypothetical protein